jgi:DNA helicase II / ATP-dependent DNA helicase PcrA
MSRTTILFGPPGTGKTTALLNEVERAMQAGSSPDRIAFFAFTRKAAHEAITRASERFAIKQDDLVWFRTLHSAAFKMLGLSSSEVMQPQHYDELATALGRGFTFEYQYDESTERVPLGGALGDLALGVYSRARSRCVTVEEEWWNVPDENNITLREAELFARTLDNFKQAYQLLDFSDFLDEVHTPLDLDLLIIDEAQDLTRQQWDFARRVGARAKRVIIAGDDDQAIFQWSGADLRTFLSLNGVLRVLPISYRLPEEIWRKTNQIAQTIRRRKDKYWQSRDEKGSVRYITNTDQADLRGSATWLLLTRLRYQLRAMESVCRAQGVVYQMDGTWSNQTPDVRAVVNYERLRRGEPLPGVRVEALAKYIPGLNDVRRKSEMLWDDVPWPFEGKPDWMNALTALGTDEREYIRTLRMNGESLVNQGRVVLSTIHGIKGGEADNVVLSPDTSARVTRGIQADPDAEARVWYVATSRARHNLMIAEPTNPNHVDV